jgi:FKBP-type peptidyl-prolyl cis-trans isomerase
LLVAAAIAVLSACGDSGVMREIERAEEAREAQARDAAAASARFIAAQRARAGVETTPTGLAYEVTAPAPDLSLPHPPGDAQVIVEYEGRLADGTVFDSSAAHGGPAQFAVDEVVPGFAEMLRLMRPGQEVIAYLPPELGYGARGAPPAIPPNSALAFRIRLLAFARPDGRLVAARVE